jgi:hypothetical protein
MAQKDDILSVIIENVANAANKMKMAVLTMISYVGDGLNWFGRTVIKPTGLTGANILGYILDKFLFGSPALRPHMKNGLWDSDVPKNWRDLASNNEGWDVYKSTNGIIDNILGILGGFIGLSNLFNHYFTSIWQNLRSSYNLLGSNGVLGAHKPYEDKRTLAVKIIFGLLSFPLYFPLAIVTNITDGILTFGKHWALSVGYNFSGTRNLLGAKGILGERQPIVDDRHLALKIVFGILSAPFVIITSGMTNLIDILGTVTKHWAISSGYIVSKTFNLLGKHGMFGEQEPTEDTRHVALKIIFGILSLPVTIPVAILTNLVNVVLTAINHTSLSFARNVRRTFNLLGKNGVFGEHQPFEDARPLALKIIFGLISSPLVALASAITNLTDLIATLLKHTALSFGYNIRSTFNLFGTSGVFGARVPYSDERPLPIRIIFGALTFAPVAVCAVVSNTIDVMATISAEFLTSYIRNLRCTVNLLGTYGVFGPRAPYVDERPLAVRIFFGTLSFVPVLVTAIVTNLFDIAGVLCRESALSYGRNVLATFNLLGEHGVFGARTPYVDNRSLAVKIIFGALTAVPVLITAIGSNSLDVGITGIYHFGLSFIRNLSCSCHLLGQHGMFGERTAYKDERSLPIKLIFGALAFPPVLCFALVINTIDLAAATVGHLFLSFTHNIKSTFNLLGNRGVFGEPIEYEDKRNLAVRIIFGALTFPVVLPCALVTNTIDLIGAYFKNSSQTIKRPATLGTGVAVFAITALPVYIVRKVIGGIANVFVHPIKDALHGDEFNGFRFVKGIANIATLGLFSAGYKIFKAATGYSRRFGFKAQEPEDNLQQRFRDACDLAATGNFTKEDGTATDQLRQARVPLRLFYGWRHSTEKVVKTIHDEFRSQQNAGETTVNSAHNFFTSERYQAVKGKIKEKEIVDAVEAYLSRPNAL